MKKHSLLVILLIVSLVTVSLTGCIPTLPGSTQPATTPASQTQPSTVPVTEAIISNGDTYWVATAYYDEETRGYEDLQPAQWSMDLTVRMDGTARFRDIHEEVGLTDDALLQLSWEQAEDGSYVFYSPLRTDPVLRGSLADNTLTLDYYDMRITMEQRQLPKTAGQTYVPAELAGTWLMVSTEVEGDENPAMPFQLSSLVLRTGFDDQLVLVADMEERDYYAQMQYSAYEQAVTVLDTPLYEGCENEAWSVRIGSTTETELYATLLDDNTLLLQRKHTIDGHPAVSYQTYWRFPELVSWSDPEYMQLDASNWKCVAYTDFQQETGSPPAEMEDFSLILNSDGTCLASYGDGAEIQGTWTVSTGGVLLMRGAQDEFWFGGAVTHYCQLVDGESRDVYKMSLYYDGGILRLSLDSYG